ncbi:MAG: glucose-6-phosphate isomerase [Clostridiales bacterium]|nr:glucose-6-phosphate isomerase [Clostridiales bacterium]
MKHVNVNIENSFIGSNELEGYKEKIILAHQRLHSGADDYTGWVDYPLNYNKEEVKRVMEVAQQIRNQSEVFIVIGIGGSYLGARAAIELLTNSFNNLLDKQSRKTPQIFFAGQNISGTYHKELLDLVQDKEVSICVISKSGTTTEPNIAFSVFKELLEKKYGSQASEHVCVITDEKKGILREETEEKGYTSFIVPDDIGGRYSVLTPVGLLPIAVAGIDIEDMLKGAADGCTIYNNDNLENPCCTYAAARNILYNKGKIIEVYESYEPKLQYVAEWLKQLFGESEGKEGKGIFPASLNMSTDLHSMGQYLQEGTPCFFETVLNIEQMDIDLKIPATAIETLRGKTMNDINNKAMEGVILAHIEDSVPNIKIDIPEISAYYFGQLVYFFEKSCALSGYLLGVFPFDQPGVEKYKRNMKELITENQFEDER